MQTTDTSQADLAREAGVSRSLICRVLKEGKAGLKAAIGIAKATGEVVPASWWLK